LSTLPARRGPGELFVEDCVKGMARLSDGSVDAVVTDPPYGYGIGARPWDSFKGLDAFQGFTERWATEARRVLRPGGAFAVFAGPRLAHRAAVGLERAGCTILDQVVWLFGNGAGINVQHGKLKPGHELIILASREPLPKGRASRLRVEARRLEAAGQPVREPTNVVLSEGVAKELDEAIGPLTSGSRRAGVRSTIGMMKGSSGDDSPPIVGSSGYASRYFYVARYRGHRDRPDHVTVKPVSLMAWIIGLVAKPGDLVLDPFIGSGTTAIAAQLCGCRWIGFEEDAAVAEAARERIAKEAGGQGALPF